MLMRTHPDHATEAAQRFLDAAAPRLRAPALLDGPLRFGIDLGTATIVVTAVDAQAQPVYWDFVRAQVVRDGVVVDFQGAVDAVRRLKAGAEAALGTPIDAAATAHPPAVPLSDCRACSYVLQQAGIDCRSLVDEVTAANAILGVRDGAVVDVGGGSTGVGVFRAGALARLSDLAGGGHHLDLILAGALRITVEAAEVHKRERGGDILQVLRPGIERMAESVRRQCGGVDPGTVHLAGGALTLPGADAVVERYLGWAVRGYRHAELITPFGIALS
ncbi:MAG: ethanolamine utilization protein EutJ [Ideonella sp. WA131b]|jgi:ethanolamine utilization protein EutJ|nr:ethanolamine utilization protein EutJ [Ideonella sp. WA131b]